ncbi:MAG: serine/threonine protein kinase [Gemmatimonadota bacterium]|nr:MAG: serine/threonine protein kinase [Gemmatimonadota bacterium]
MMDRIDQFELIAELSRSSTTTVFKAYQSTLERFVLLKQLHPHLTREEDIVRRFEREAKAAARIKHEHIVDVYDYGKWQDVYYIAMEFVDGITLKTIIDRDGPLPPEIAATILRGTLKGLAHAHSKGVFHRDMKPANILVSTQGVVKITDFGLALITDYPSITAQDGVVGTPAYMSPEQASGDEIDGRSDIFSLGLTFFEMLAGRRAYEGDSFSACITQLLTEDPPKIRDIRKDVPLDVADVLEKMVTKSVSKRYQTCDEILEDIHRCSSLPEQLVGKEDLAAYISSPHKGQIVVTSPASKRRLSKTRLAVIGIVCISLVALIAGGLILFPKGSEDRTEEPFTFHTPEIEEPSQNEEPDTTTPTLPQVQTITQEMPQTGQEKPPEQSATETTPAGMDTVEIAPNGLREHQFEEPPLQEQPLETGYGTLEINCLPWADVYIDDRYIDTTPLQNDISLEIGSHKVALVNPDFPPYFENVEIESNQRTRIDVSLLTKVGFLDVNVHPWATVILDEDSIDTTPLAKPIMLRAGTHTLRLANPRFGVFEEKIGIVASETLRVNRNLTELFIE